LRGEASAQLFLIGNAAIRNQAKDLTVTECLVRIHGVAKNPAPCIFIHATAYSCQLILQLFAHRSAAQEDATPEKQVM
jgi:hypothetical protein